MGTTILLKLGGNANELLDEAAMVEVVAPVCQGRYVPFQVLGLYQERRRHLGTHEGPSESNPLGRRANGCSVSKMRLILKDYRLPDSSIKEPRSPRLRLLQSVVTA